MWFKKIVDSVSDDARIEADHMLNNKYRELKSYVDLKRLISYRKAKKDKSDVSDEPLVLMVVHLEELEMMKKFGEGAQALDSGNEMYRLVRGAYELHKK